MFLKYFEILKVIMVWYLDEVSWEERFSAHELLLKRKQNELYLQ